MLRAIYIGDMIHPHAVVFEYDKDSNRFLGVEDNELFYDFVIVMNNPDWLVFAVGGEDVVRLENPHRLTDDQIANRISMED